MGFDAITDEKYHCMHKYTHPLQVPNRTMVGREKEMKQIRAAMNRPELCNVLLLGEAGSGKALSNDTLIPVVDDRKYVCIKDIKVGDYVFDEASDPTRVLGVYPQGFIHAYEMTFSNGASVICNEEHLWQASLNKSDWGVCTLFDMMAAGIVDEAGNPQWSVPLGAVGQVDVVSVVDLHDDMEMTCLYVEADSHLFQVTESRIVTHNTMLVQSTMQNDRGKLYLEVDLSRMVANCSTDVNQMAAKLKSLFDEVSRYVKEEHEEVVLFMDEFHQVVQLSDAAVEALKPLLADSGVRGIRVITATTPVEFRRHISPNQPLVERLQRINLSQTDKETTISILKGMAARYGVADQIYNDAIYESIYEYTNRYIPANAQPRKSILIMDAMIGWHRAEGRKIDKYLLADVIYESEGVNVAFKVDASKIKARLDKKVLSQKFATQVIEQRLQLCVADLNNKSRPMSSFLFSGSSGSGKGLWDEELVPVYMPDGSVFKKRNGSLEVGDYVFNRLGKPVKVTGVYHRGLKDVYRVTLDDGRSVVVDGSHLWTWHYSHGHKNEGFVTTNTEDLIRRGLTRTTRNGYLSYCIRIPMNEAVAYPEQSYELDPYVVGAFIGDGSLTIKYELTLSSANDFIPKQVASLIGAESVMQRHKNYNWVFVKGVKSGFRGGSHNNVFTRDEVFSSVSELCDLHSYEKFIPERYKYGSIEQRWHLIQGLFDTDGSIVSSNGNRFSVQYTTTSYQLALDVQEVLYSLGIASTISDSNRGDGRRTEYTVIVRADNSVKSKFFRLPKKLARAEKAAVAVKNRYHDYSMVAIKSIEKLDEQLPTTCIMVDDDEHLYQCGQFIVTHNTEMVKSLAEILFDDDRSLLRFDCTEFANADSLERFRRELTARAWEHPHSIILLDEIEKACSPVTRLLLQVLDDGRLIDENNREVSFINAYIVMTTNAGSEIYRTIAQYAADDDGSGKSMSRYDKLIRNSISTTTGDNRFPPELLGRIDCIVPFQPLSEETMKAIARMKLQQMRRDILQRHGIKVLIQQNVIRYLVEDNLDTDSDSGGARTVVSKMESEVTTKIAKFINNNPGVYKVRVSVEGTLAADDVTKLLSDAYIKVEAAM